MIINNSLDVQNRLARETNVRKHALKGMINWLHG